MKKEKLIILSRDYLPDNSPVARLIGELSQELSVDYDITVIHSEMFYYFFQTSRPKDFVLNNGRQIKIKSYYNGPKNKVLRLLDEIYFSFISLFYLIKYKGRVLTVTMPIFNQLFLSFFFIFSRRKLYIISYELVPELMNVASLISTKNFFYKGLMWLSGKFYQRAEKVFCIGPLMKKQIIKTRKINSSKIILIHNWEDENYIYPSKVDHPILDELKKFKLTLGVTGNVGHYFYSMPIKNILNNFSDIGLLFIGSFHYKILSSITFNSLDEQIMSLPYFPWDERNISGNLCDLYIISNIQKASGVLVPSKIYFHMLCAKPILAIADKNSLIYDLISKADCGWVFDYDELDKIELVISEVLSNKAILKEKGYNGYQFYQEHLGKDRSINLIRSHLSV